MFKITHDAATLLSDARAASGVPEQFGVRFSLVETPQQGQALAFDFVEKPEPENEVAEEEGLSVYVTRELATVAGNSTLDARETNGRTQLVLRPDSREAGH